MHRGFLIAVAAVGVLTVQGCGSGTPTTASNASSTPSAFSTSSTPSASSTPSTSASTSTSASSSCAGLDAKMVPLHGAASGTTFADLVVTNHSTTACTLPAQPALAYFSATHKALPVEFSANPDLKPYNLAPGASAAMVVGYGSAADPPCDGAIAFVRVASLAGDLPFSGRTNCVHDTTYEEGWVAGTYSAPH
ncbi:hypothetical protein Caci_7061 [Catenulispora acidiphila DSM 44928]|uniref:DUF4232 domain-containing protein n=1 Tax=Catenulispora acidiphila (strain DSM 44928 / JCM 14897 / NBRC 102108 / NRRL B-24433 / ID139908) TaxID=479433 RepID=C7Q5C2_CATAD|nr:DUF4232 domain-containing protein [Catenulispora acidiphila]ACU75891.1 hypothetical protein Caci_7061 [Catenulispora acidiphila DSM 44928]